VGSLAGKVPRKEVSNAGGFTQEAVKAGRK